MTLKKDFFFWTFRFDVMTIAIENKHELNQTFPRDDKHSVLFFFMSVIFSFSIAHD